jgi:hypothetical protein
VSAEDKGEFFQSCTLTMKLDGFQWMLLNIYGPAHDDRKLEFLEEIQKKVLSSDLPMMLGGDFNLVRKVEEKSSGNVDAHLMEAFNDMINVTSLRELHRSGSRYTWTNKQNPPIMCVLDRVLVSNAWEDRYNLSTVVTAPRLGSDHNPLMLDTGDILSFQQHYFRFSAHWLNQGGFKEWVQSKWPARYKYDPLDHWHVLSSKLRRAIKGWGQNNDSQQKKLKQDILRLSGRRDMNLIKIYRRFCQMRNYSGKGEGERNGSWLVTLTQVTSINVLMVEEGKCRLICWKWMVKR